jgi:hypothetical protein
MKRTRTCCCGRWVVFTVGEDIRFPVIEVLLRDYLKSRDPDLRVVTVVPADRPASFVRLVRVGGPRRDLVTDVPMVVFECWAVDEFAAAELGTRVRAWVFALDQSEHAEGWVRKVTEVGGLQAFPDPLSGTPRYQFTAQFQTRGVPVEY